ncbi:MAG: hypothetical protein ACTSYL_11735 [Candidatus Thorarchaeota archaeon]
MVEHDVCPYCGAPIEDVPFGSPDESVMITCSHCGGRFEYIAGFGAFKPEGAVTSDGAGPRATIRPEFSRLRELTSRPVAKIGEKKRGSTCCKCAIVFCMCWLLLVLIVAFVTVIRAF